MILPACRRIAVACTVVWLASPSPGPAAVAPYTPDPFTLHLWHLDEATAETLPEFSTMDGVAADPIPLDIRGGARLGVASLTAALGGALDTRGIPGTGQTPGAFGPEDLPLSRFTGAGGAFTIEAIVRLGFDPSQLDIAGRTDPLQLVSLDNEGVNALRPFQWRVLPPGHAENFSELWAIEFINIAPAAGIERFQFPLPNGGPDALATDAWYHAAIAFTGEPGVDGNLTCLWTRLGQGTATAQFLGSATMLSAPGDGVDTTPGDLSVGNIGRGTGTNNFVGLIDEVRLSAVARGPGDFRLDGTPYTPDAGTLHLFHFDEPNPPNFPASVQSSAADAATVDPLTLTGLANGARLGQPSLPGFNSAVDTADSGLSGTPASNDAVLAALPLVNGAADNIVLSYADPDSGAFTFEAIVRLDVDLTESFTGTARGVGFMHILSGEQDGAGGGERAWQFRIDPIGSSPNADGFTGPLVEPVIEFINVNGGAAPVQNRILPLPTAGPHAVAAGAWFHVAAAYTGEEGVADNLSIYWTRIDDSRTQAELLGTKTLETDLPLPGTGVDLTIGNIGRTAPNGNFLGLIDEVRISSIARAPNDFIFSGTGPAPVAPAIISITADTTASRTTVTWTSQTGQTYKVERSADLVAWTTLASNLPGQAASTSFTDIIDPPFPRILFYRITTPGG